jgi:hypothetical protein
MTPGTHRVVSMLTDFLASDALEAAARRTGFVQRTSKLTGKLFLALVPFGAWSDATPTLAHLAATATPLDEQGAGAPDALQQRRNRRALAFLQALRQRARAKVQAVAHVCDDGLCTDFPKGERAESTGLALPDSLHALLPGSGGRAATAGANIPAVWDDKSRVWGHGALPPGHMPAQTDVDTGVARAHKGVLFLGD